MLQVCITLYGKKKLVPQEKLIPRHSVYALILNDDKILLVNTKSTNKYWFPGGVIDNEESKEEALKREVLEEAGIEVEVEKLLTEVESYFYFDHTDEAYHQYSSFYICKPKQIDLSGDTNTDLHDEAEKPQWIEISSLKETDFQDYGW